LKQLEKNNRPVVLTVNGKVATIVQDAKAYQRLLISACSTSPPGRMKRKLSVKAWRM
jgi:hypothetical protein